MPLSDTSALTTPSTSEIDTPSSIMAFSTEEFSLLLALGNCYDGNQNEVDFDLMQAASPTVVHDPASPCIEGIFTDVNNIYVGQTNNNNTTATAITTTTTTTTTTTGINPEAGTLNMNSDVAPDITNFDVYMNNDLQFSIVNESPSSNNSSNPTAAANPPYDLLTTFQGPFTTTEGSFDTFSTDCRAGINNYPTTFNENCDAGFVAGVKNYNRRGSKDIDIIINGSRDLNINDSSAANTVAQRANHDDNKNDYRNNYENNTTTTNKKKKNEKEKDMDDNGTNYGTDDSNNSNGSRKPDRVEESNDRNEQIRTQETLAVEAPSPSRTSRKRKTSEELEITQDEKRAKFLERNRQAALKCRQKKKEFTTNLKKHVENLEAEKTIFTNTVNHLREQVLYLKSLMICHGGCDCGIIPEYLQTYGIQMPATIIQSQQQPPPQQSRSQPQQPQQQTAQRQHSHQYTTSASNFLA